jgi:hypothetical protein
VVDLYSVEFLTWSQNRESGEWFAKFHLPSGKDCRIKVTKNDLNSLIKLWEEIKNDGDENELDKKER